MGLQIAAPDADGRGRRAAWCPVFHGEAQDERRCLVPAADRSVFPCLVKRLRAARAAAIGIVLSARRTGTAIVSAARGQSCRSRRRI